ncbi:MAG TPA: class I SAM-dependent methyltransferase [Azospirillaceae bacterium]|nr:class I SAM-dependent methyltransferase [Azospirillaceae bacterium]
MEKVYLSDLRKMVDLCRAMPNTKMLATAKVNAMVLLNMSYEKVMVDRNFSEHPYTYTRDLVRHINENLQAWNNIQFAEMAGAVSVAGAHEQMEEMHQDLFQTLWTKFSPEDYNDRIQRYVYRLELNGLGKEFAGGRCIDFGCGHGNFAHALLRKGAKYVLGIDYGEGSVKFAERARDNLGVSRNDLEFRLSTVYDVSEPDGSFDFAIQNGVFHHLDDEDRAYKEVHRVLKPGGYFWVYTDGEGAINHDLWDASREALSDIPFSFIVEHLEALNLSTGKRYHLGDGLNAVYRHTSWDEITSRLARLGFGEFRRITGGFDTDFDHDVIAADKYGREKFGEGDLRLICRKL